MNILYRLVMDPDVNPLRDLFPAQRFQIMTYLGIMWSTIFCAAIGAWAWYGEIVIVHVLLAMGLLITGWTFHNATQLTSYRDHPLPDGTARYDDVWGAS